MDIALPAGRLVESDPDLATRHALWIDPTDPGPTGAMFGIANLPNVMSVGAEHHYPVRSVRSPPQTLPAGNLSPGVVCLPPLARRRCTSAQW